MEQDYQNVSAWLKKPDNDVILQSYVTTAESPRASPRDPRKDYTYVSPKVIQHIPRNDDPDRKVVAPSIPIDPDCSLRMRGNDVLNKKVEYYAKSSGSPGPHSKVRPAVSNEHYVRVHNTGRAHPSPPDDDVHHGGVTGSTGDDDDSSDGSTQGYISVVGYAPPPPPPSLLDIESTDAAPKGHRNQTGSGKVHGYVNVPRDSDPKLPIDNSIEQDKNNENVKHASGSANAESRESWDDDYVDMSHGAVSTEDISKAKQGHLKLIHGPEVKPPATESEPEPASEVETEELYQNPKEARERCTGHSLYHAAPSNIPVTIGSHQNKGFQPDQDPSPPDSVHSDIYDNDPAPLRTGSATDVDSFTDPTLVDIELTTSGTPDSVPVLPKAPEDTSCMPKWFRRRWNLYIGIIVVAVVVVVLLIVALVLILGADQKQDVTTGQSNLSLQKKKL